MTIVKWTVSPWSKPSRQEYCKETKHFYMHARGRGRDAKDSNYIRYFDSESEALEYIRQREENKAEQKRIEKIQRCGVELLEALELAAGDLWYQIEMHHGAESASKYPSIVGARAAIAKAKGEA